MLRIKSFKLVCVTLLILLSSGCSDIYNTFKRSKEFAKENRTKHAERQSQSYTYRPPLPSEQVYINAERMAKIRTQDATADLIATIQKLLASGYVVRCRIKIEEDTTEIIIDPHPPSPGGQLINDIDGLL